MPGLTLLENRAQPNKLAEFKISVNLHDEIYKLMILNFGNRFRFTSWAVLRDGEKNQALLFQSLRILFQRLKKGKWEDIVYIVYNIFWNKLINQ